MIFRPVTISDWPKLAWVANIPSDGSTVEVLHGPMVEATDEWIVEAVWAGEFGEGDFDQTDLVFGTGIRCRGNRVTLVSSGTIFDRLLMWRGEKCLWVANTLPGLLACAELSLLDDYLDYSRDIRSMAMGLTARTRTIPTSRGPVESIYFNNVVVSSGNIEEIAKPDTVPEFDSYQTYAAYLKATAQELGRNAQDPARANAITPVTSLSSGYDSSAAAVVSRYAQCDRAVTITDSTSLWRGSDSGEQIARHLNLKCDAVGRTAATYPTEVAIWASEGRADILNWTLFNYPKPLSLFFTGSHARKVWDRSPAKSPDPFVRGDQGSLSFCEFRLIKGVFQCVVPFLGVRHCEQLQRITISTEMAPWVMGSDYDKPIARRIVEEAGVPREAFAQRNKNTSLAQPFRWPFSPDCQASFATYLRKRGHWAPSKHLLKLLRAAAHTDGLIYRNITERLPGKRWPRPWDSMRGPSLMFHWANLELKRTYEQGLKITGLTPGATQTSTIGSRVRGDRRPHSAMMHDARTDSDFRTNQTSDGLPEGTHDG